ncbi:hypothetical protein MMC16_002123 [Acarospora aff. strigata]|nr:hypothetical protein [Acarospora aff. strigata]
MSRNRVATFGPAFKDQEKERRERDQKGLEAAESPGLPLPEPERKPAGDGEQITSAEAPMSGQVDEAEEEAGRNAQRRADQQHRKTESVNER